MSTPIKPLISGLEALEQKRYVEAIELLEMFCQLSQINREYWQAQMSLVRAYIGAGQKQKAIALSKKLLASRDFEVQVWAQNFIAELFTSVVPLGTTPQDSLKNTVDTSLGIKLKTLDELKEFYRQYLLPDLKEFEERRKAVFNQITTVGIVLSTVVLALFIFFPYSWLNFSTTKAAKFSFTIVFLFLLAFVGCMYAWVVFYSSSTEAYANGFKSKIIQQIINFIDDRQILRYSQSDSAEMILAAFEHSRIFHCPIAPIKLTQNDYISGRIGKTNILFSEIRAEIEVAHNWLKYLDFTQSLLLNRTVGLPIYLCVFFLVWTVYKGTPYIIGRMLQGQRIDYNRFEEEVLKNQVTRRSVFKGLFFQAEFHKNFQGKTLVVPKVIDISKLYVINRSNKEAIQLEDPEFSQLFTVYSDDQIIARYILSTSLMARLVRFKKKAKRNIYISFVDSKIYIAVEYAEDLFEPLLFKTMLGFAPIREYFETLQLMLGIVDELNLNRRIWHR